MEKSNENPEENDLDKAKKLLEIEHQKKVQSAAAEIQAILDKYGLTIVVTKPEIRLQ